MTQESRCCIDGCGREANGPLRGMFALRLCAEHDQIVSCAHREAREVAERAGERAPMLTLGYAQEVVRRAVERAAVGPEPFVAQEYATAMGPAWCAIEPHSGIVVATTTQEAASHAADALNAAYRLGAQHRWCETVPVEYADAAANLMGAAEHATDGYDVLADECLADAQRAITRLRGGREGDEP